MLLVGVSFGIYKDISSLEKKIPQKHREQINPIDALTENLHFS